MGFAGKLALGLAKGLAGYHGELARQEAEERKAQILANKEMALAQFKSKLTQDEDTHKGTINAGLKVVETDQRIREVKETLPARADAEERKIRTKGQIDADAREDEQRFKFDLTRYEQQEQTARTKLEQAGQDRRARENVINDSWVEVFSRTDGTAHRYNLITKQMVKFAGSGAKPTATSNDEDKPQRKLPRRGSAPQEEPSSAAPPGDAPPSYTIAEAEQTAAQYGVTVDVVHQQMRARGYKLAK